MITTKSIKWNTYIILKNTHDWPLVSIMYIKRLTICIQQWHINEEYMLTIDWGNLGID